MRRRVVASLGTVLMSMASWLAAPPAMADVVPQRAIEVGEAFVRAIDAGRYDAALRTLDRGGTDGARAEVARLARGRPPGRSAIVRDRVVRSWGGHGPGDQSAMPPGSYWALVFEGSDAAGRTVVDEVRVVPRPGDDWRIVDYVRSP